MPATERFRTFDGIAIAYQEWGDPGSRGPAVILHHGFVADASTNWVVPGVVEALVAAGRRVIAPDARGHGRSEKPHDPGQLRGGPHGARPGAARAGETGQTEIDLVGYSMGAVVALIYASSGGKTCADSSWAEWGRAWWSAAGWIAASVSNESIIEALDGERSVHGERVRRGVGSVPSQTHWEPIARRWSRRPGRVYRGGVDLASISAPTLLLAGDAGSAG